MIYISYCWSRIWDTLEKILHVAHSNSGKGVETQIPLLTSFFELATHPLVSCSCCWAHTMRGWYHIREQQGSAAPCTPRAKGYPRTGSKGAGKGRPRCFNQKSNSPGESVVMRQVQVQAWQDPWVQWSLAGPCWWGRAIVKAKLQSCCGLEKQIQWPGTGLAAAELLLQSRAELEWDSGAGLGWWGCSSWDC